MKVFSGGGGYGAGMFGCYDSARRAFWMGSRGRPVLVKSEVVAELDLFGSFVWLDPPRPLLVADLRRIHRWMKSAGSVECDRTPPQRSHLMNGGLVETCDPAIQQPLRQPTIAERLANEEQALRDRLEKVCQIREGLGANPEVADLLDGLSQLGLGRY